MVQFMYKMQHLVLNIKADNKEIYWLTSKKKEKYNWAEKQDQVKQPSGKKPSGGSSVHQPLWTFQFWPQEQSNHSWSTVDRCWWHVTPVQEEVRKRDRWVVET